MTVAETSIEAYRPKKGEEGRKQRRDVFIFILGKGEYGATNDEVSAETGLPMSSVSARRNELMNQGLVVDSGERRKTRLNKSAAVFIVDPKKALKAKSILEKKGHW